MVNTRVYQFYAELDYSTAPKIWRRFQVSDDITVAELGYITMSLFEMRAHHLMQLEVPTFEEPAAGEKPRRRRVPLSVERYGIPDDTGEDVGIDATRLPLRKVISEPGKTIIVTYDFGDYWQVPLLLEIVFTGRDIPDTELPHVIAGRGFGIVEDCGGIEALLKLVKAFKEKEGEAYEELSEWLGVDDFDITVFDLDDMNFRVKNIPAIYKKIYENYAEPNKKEVDLIERRCPAKKARDTAALEAASAATRSKDEFATIDEYIAAQPAAVQPFLRGVHKAIRGAAPEAEERVTYGMPCFWQRRNLIYFRATKKHIGVYPTAKGMAAFVQKLTAYKTSKGAIQFPLDKPPDYSLIAAITRFLVEDVTAKKRKK